MYWQTLNSYILTSSWCQSKPQRSSPLLPDIQVNTPVCFWMVWWGRCAENWGCIRPELEALPQTYRLMAMICLASIHTRRMYVCIASRHCLMFTVTINSHSPNPLHSFSAATISLKLRLLSNSWEQNRFPFSMYWGYSAQLPTNTVWKSLPPCTVSKGSFEIEVVDSLCPMPGPMVSKN